MKKILFLAIPIVVIASCTNENGQGLTESIGSIAVELNDTVRYSYFLPGTGTFEFRQSFERGTKPSMVTTELKIVDNSGTEKEQQLELMVFENTKFSTSNLDFIENFAITINDGNADYKEISTNGGVLIDSTNNFYIALFDETVITGKYTGEIRILQEQPVDSNNTEQDVIVESLLNVYGNVNIDNRLFLLVKEENAIFSSVSGIFSSEHGLFFGEALKGENSFPLTPQATRGVAFNEGNAEAETQTTLTYNLLFNTDGKQKKLEINLTKTN